MSFLEIALRNAARGYRVHPLRGKDAILKNWPNVATTDESTIKAWAEKFPEYNCGIAAGPDVAIVDSDRVSRLKELSGEHAVEWFDTFSVTSGRPDRAHFYYRMADAAREFGNKKWAEPGIAGNVFEMKVHGGQVVAEGSIHPDSGQVYRITQDLPLIPFPAGLVALMRECYGKDNGPRERVPREKISEGGRHDALVREAGRIQRVTEMSKPVLTAHLEDFNEQWLEPPLDSEEVARVAMSCNWQPEPEYGEITIGSSQPKEPEPKDWRLRYLTFEQVRDAKPVEFLIEGFLALDSITAIAAPVGQRKSLIALNVAHALCTGEPLFDYFKVVKRPDHVVFLCPEMGLSSFSMRLKQIGLDSHVGQTLFCQTMDDESIKLKDLDEELPRAVVIIDTLTRFVEGDQNSSEDMSKFAKVIFGLKRRGATVLLLHHSIKGAANALTLDSAMRGSTELAAFVTCCWATRLQDPDPDAQYRSPSLLVNVKQRDFESKSFAATSDETCRMRIVGEPGKIAELKSKGDADAEAVLAAILKESPKMGVNKLQAALRAAGHRKGVKWVSKTRAGILGTGATLSLS